MFKLNFAGSSSATAATTAPFNFTSGSGKQNVVMWVVIGAVGLFGLALWLRSKKGN